MRSVTIQDVAKYAGVSIATVSRVLNNNPSVDQLMRQKVLDAMQYLHYQPSRIARRLRRASHDVIGVIISDIQNPYFTSVIRGIEDAAFAYGMHIVLCNTDEDPQKFHHYLEIMRAEGVTGLIISPPKKYDNLITELKDNKTAAVFVDRAIGDNHQLDIVKVDNQAGAYQATHHLIRLGRRRIAIIYPDIVTGHERLWGYQAALQDAGLTPDSDLIISVNHTSDLAYLKTYDLISSPHPPDALFTTTGLVTLGALRAVRHLNRAIPKDIAIVGFDDIEWAEVLYSPLTVIRQPTYQLGQEAVHMLVARLDHPSAPQKKVILQTTLVVRESCGSAQFHSHFT